MHRGMRSPELLSARQPSPARHAHARAFGQAHRERVDLIEVRLQLHLGTLAGARVAVDLLAVPDRALLVATGDDDPRLADALELHLVDRVGRVGVERLAADVVAGADLVDALEGVVPAGGVDPEREPA